MPSLLDDLLTNPKGLLLSVSPVRRQFMAWLLAQKGKTALMGAKGPNAFDCSGLFTCALLSVGGPNMRLTWNAQKLHDAAPKTASPLPGDAIFYGQDANSVVHIAIWCANGWVISASGATHRISTIEAAEAAGASVRLHPRARYRPDFLCFRTNIWLDQLEREQTK